MGNLLKTFKVPERSKIENTTVPGSETYPDVEQTIPGGKNLIYLVILWRRLFLKAAVPGSGEARGKATDFWS